MSPRTATPLPLTINEQDLDAAHLCDNRSSEAAQCVNTERPLTRSLDLGEEGLAVNATRKQCACGCGRLAKTGRNYYAGHKPTTLEGRIMAKVVVDPATGCWVWHGARHSFGHGNINLGNGRYGSTHRVMYEIKRGSIPPGLDLDHLCRNPPCCNPDHLEPVTHRENVRRGESPTAAASRNGTCTRGHSLDNAYRRKSNGRIAYCRQCRRERDRCAP